MIDFIEKLNIDEQQEEINPLERDALEIEMKIEDLLKRLMINPHATMNTLCDLIVAAEELVPIMRKACNEAHK